MLCVLYNEPKNIRMKIYITMMQDGCNSSVLSVLWIGAVRVTNSRGVPFEVQNGTQQDLTEMINWTILGGKKIIYMLKVGGVRNGTL